MILFVSLGLMNPSQAATRRRCGAARPGRCGARSVRSDLGPQARFGQVRLRSALMWWFGGRPVGVPTPRPRHGSAAGVRVDRRGPRPRDRAVLTFLLSECEANWAPAHADSPASRPFARFQSPYSAGIQQLSTPYTIYAHDR